MKCSPVKIGGNPVILCGGQRVAACIVCQEIAGKLCDWKISGGTCDAALCDEHAAPVGDNLDLCPKHAKAWETHPANAQAELPL